LKTGLFVVIEGYALIVVIPQRRKNERRLLRNGEHATTLRADRHAGAGVRMEDALDVLTPGVYGAVDYESGTVDWQRRLAHLLALLVHEDKRRGGDLLEEQTVGIDEEVMLRPGKAGTDVREHEVGPAVAGNEPIAGRQVAAQLPLFGAHHSLE
jgi:hypothetical protein